MFRNSRRKKIKKSAEALKNARGRVYYGMHFYPGICEYSPQGKRPFRVFLNEDTIRKMDKTFSGRPVYVHHPDDPISQNLDIVRGEADGWVIRSFYNEKDGKHWVQFIVVTDAGELAVRRGWKLSNCYEGLMFGDSGTWNGMNYNKEILDGEYEHLAIVPDPRYEESIILTPEEFKKYNDTKDLELKRLANSKEKKKMGFKIFTRKLIKDNDLLKNAMVMLPTSKREVALEKLISEADQHEKDKANKFVNTKALVKFEGEKMTVGELLEAHADALDEIQELRDKLKNRKGKKNNMDKGYNEADEDDEELENESDEDDEELENESDEDDDDKDDDDKDDDKDKKKSKNKKSKNSRRADDADDDDDDDDGFDDFENNILENDSDDGDEETEEGDGKRRQVKNKEIDEDDEDNKTSQRRHRNNRGNRRRKQKKIKNESRKKNADKRKADQLRNAHNRARDDERYGDGLDPLARGQAMFGSAKAN